MKKLLFILSFLICAYVSNAQVPAPPYSPNAPTAKYKIGYVLVDSAVISRPRDTSWNVSLPGAFVYWQNSGTDSSVWISTGRTTGQRWQRVVTLPAGSGSGVVIAVTANGPIYVTGTAANPIINIDTGRGYMQIPTGYDLHKVIDSLAYYKLDKSFGIQGRVLFRGVAGVSQDGLGLFYYDSTNTRLGIGTAAPQTVLHLESSNSGSMVTLRNTNGTSGIRFFASGGVSNSFDKGYLGYYNCVSCIQGGKMNLGSSDYNNGLAPSITFVNTLQYGASVIHKIVGEFNDTTKKFVVYDSIGKQTTSSGNIVFEVDRNLRTIKLPFVTNVATGYLAAISPVSLGGDGSISFVPTSGGGIGTVSSVVGGFGLNGGTITTSGTLLVDTSALSTKANVTASLLGKLNLSDTASMLSTYAHFQAVVKYYDTSNMLSGYARTGNLTPTSSGGISAFSPNGANGVTISNGGSLTALTFTVGLGDITPTTVTPFATSTPPSYALGKIWTDLNTGTTSVYTTDPGGSLQLGYENRYLVMNSTGSAIGNGVVVAISGTTGSVPNIVLANSNALATVQFVCVTTQGIANGMTGSCTALGTVNGISTIGFTSGVKVYASTVSGTFTSTVPVYPNYTCPVGVIGAVGATTGTITVYISTPELNPTANASFVTLSATGLSRLQNLTVVGNAQATTFIGALTGNATTATAWATGRTVGMTGDVTYTSGSLTGAANVTGTATLTTVNSSAGLTNGLTTDAKGRVLSYSPLTATATFANFSASNNINVAGFVFTNNAYVINRNSTPSVTGTVIIQTLTGVNRVQDGFEDTEAGANTGTNPVKYAYSDAGTTIGMIMKHTRATLATQFGGAVTLPSLTSTGAIVGLTATITNLVVNSGVGLVSALASTDATGGYERIIAPGGVGYTGLGPILLAGAAADDYIFRSGAAIKLVSGSTNLAATISAAGVVTFQNLAGTGSRAVLASSTGDLSAPISDSTVKENIESIKYGLGTLMKLNPVRFQYKEGWKNYGEGWQEGLLAQEVAKIIPEAVFRTPTTGKLGIDYMQFDAIYIKAIQELNNKVESQEKEIQELKKLVNKLISKIK